MFAAPSYATDPQLSQMAQGGLPSALNEMETRAALRRGAQVVPAPMPAPKPKMTGEQMIEDFVNRVRAENEQARNSLVPAGTPLPQPQPQPAPKSQGIAGFQTGGVNTPSWFEDIANPRYVGAPGIGPMTMKNPYHDKPDLSWLEDNINPDTSWMNDNLTIKPFKESPLAPGFLPEALTGKDAGSVGVGFDIGSIKGPPQRTPPKFEGFETIDPLAAGDKAVAAGKDRIDRLTAPFDELKQAYGKDVERTERNRIFDALIQGGIAMITKGAASFDPASGDLMGVLGAGAQQYAASLMKSDNRISELREKIAVASGKAAEVGFNAETVLHGRGMSAAQHQNTMAANLAQLKTMHSGNVMDFIMQGDQLALQKEIAEFEAKSRVLAAEIEGAGEGSKAMLEVFKAANEAYLKAFDPATIAAMSPEERAQVATKASNDRKQVMASGMQMLLGYDSNRAHALAEEMNNRLVMREDSVFDPKKPGKLGKNYNYPEAPRAPTNNGIDADGIVNMDASMLFGVPGLYPGS